MVLLIVPDRAIGVFICQPRPINGKEVLVPISFKLTLTQSRYSATEKELLAIITILKKFSYLCHCNVEVYSYHQSLSLIQDKSTQPPLRVARFLDVLGAFSPTVYYLEGKKTFMADILSRYQEYSIKATLDEKELLKDGYEVTHSVKIQLLEVNPLALESLDESQLARIKKKLQELGPLEEVEEEGAPLDI